ncbi:MAG: hypothetical protein JWO79_4293 [Actinomycetia bacterium]|nr:hypothetical protein [Actinomycetes bacterium]
MADEQIGAAALAGLLAERDRLAVFAAIVLGAGSAPDVAVSAGLDTRAVTRALQKLRAGGLVSDVDGRLAADPDVFKRAARAAALATPEDSHGASDPGVAAVLRTFLRDGRLASIPVPRAKRLVVLEHIAMGFEPGVRYPEREVNVLLRAWHDDHAALRRYLVEEGLLGRANGEYWRTGGPVQT